MKRFGLRGWLAAVTCAASVGALSAWAAGGALYVSVLSLPVHSQPTAYSETLGTLEYGAAVDVLKEIAAERKETGDLPPWAEIQNGGVRGYVPAACLVSAKVLAKQSNVSEEEVTKAQRRFSEEESGDLKTMKGLGGSASGGAANYAAIDQIIAGSENFADVKSRYQEFRQQGRVGEFSE
jgi:hypothetical protein